MTAAAATGPAVEPFFTDTTQVRSRLAETGYLADDATTTAVFLADRLGKPLLVEGPAGVGKTELARAIATTAGAELIRLQCYEGIDEARALYEWNHAKQILHIQSTGNRGWDETKADIFSEEFLLPRPLLRAIAREERRSCSSTRSTRPTSTSRACCSRCSATSPSPSPRWAPSPRAASRRPADVECDPRAVRGAQAAVPVPVHRLPRRDPGARDPRVPCPAIARRDRAGDVRIVGVLRSLDLRKKPSVAETIDWGHTLLALGVAESKRARLDDDVVERTLGVVLKHRPDLAAAVAELKLGR